MLLELLLICCIVVNIVDISGFMDTVKGWICKVLNRPQQEYSIKPFDCSYCMTHHIGLLWMLIGGGFSLGNYAFLLILCCFTPVIKDIIILIKDIMSMLIDKIYFLLNNNQN